ncbi:MAG: hypothetical protein AUK31_03005 [Fibrobacteres bacterium CG2_30_45_31]|nr:MAG: hypothetical protein AUK31_03005 [Fibrobacteres bacterium CG2_30_45_31]
MEKTEEIKTAHIFLLILLAVSLCAATETFYDRNGSETGHCNFETQIKKVCYDVDGIRTGWKEYSGNREESYDKDGEYEGFCERHGTEKRCYDADRIFTGKIETTSDGSETYYDNSGSMTGRIINVGGGRFDVIENDGTRIGSINR